jgi:hypothetical protein
MLHQITTIVGPGAGLLHLAWLISFWSARGITWATMVSAVVDLSLIYLTAGPALQILRERLELKPKRLR